jgi:diguanylate cyclase (GGDEF)-like protein
MAGSMSRLRLSSLRYRLLLLVLLAALPAFALVFFTADEQERQAVQRAEDEALRVARAAATDQARLIAGARSLLTGLAQLSDVQMHNGRSCSSLFAEVQRRFPLYANVGAIRPDGEVFCAARGAQRLENAAVQPFFQRALAAREFAVSGYLADASTGKPVLTLAYPAIDGAGSVWAVVFAELDLSWIGQLAERAQLPSGTVLTVSDSTGEVLARYPDLGNWTGKSAPQWAVVHATRRAGGEGMLQAPGLEGVPRLTGFCPLFEPQYGQPVYVSVGIPRHAVLVGPERLLSRNLVWTGGAMLVLVAASLAFSDLVILRRVNAVIGAATRLTGGDLSARAVVRGADEIGVMANTFNTTAERVQARVLHEQTGKQALVEWVNELDLLNHMGTVFLTCMTVEEARAAIRQLAPRVFPTHSGSVFAARSAGGAMESVVKWGPHPLPGSVLAPSDCLALRNGRAHVVEDTGAAALCRHLPVPIPPAYLCVPLSTRDDAVGALYLGAEPPADAQPARLKPAQLRVAEAMASQLGLALANVRRRATLGDQSIHDGLTGLFNQLYMEETLERELHRARRNNRPASVVMLDVEGLARHNDAFGREAGDAILRELASLLRGNLRKEDIACRYGDVFAIALSDASLDNAARRAEQLRAAVTQLRVSHDDVALRPIAVAVGLATFPQHGANAEALLKAAEASLGEAKRQRRDVARSAKAEQCETPVDSI